MLIRLKRLLLDLFCCAGGASVGYARAGFRPVGVDIVPQPHYPYEFYQDDALRVLDLLLSCRRWNGYRLSDFTAIHASPLCQGYSCSRFLARVAAKSYEPVPLLIPHVRKRLEASGLPWIIENVPGADLPDALELCGSLFGLPIQRHRWFSSSLLLFAPGSCQHIPGFYNVVGGKVRGYGSLASAKTYQDSKGRTCKREGYYPLSTGLAAMGVDWPMTLTELSQAVPPPYTEYLGRQLLNYCC
jgi:DNA (cytosine-5)-methyltransferase 1